MDDAISVYATGTTIAAGPASANVLIPSTSAGNRPRYARLASTQPCYVRIGIGAGLAAVAGDLLIQPADSVVINVAGADRVAAIQVSTAGILQISPMEDV